MDDLFIMSLPFRLGLLLPGKRSPGGPSEGITAPAGSGLHGLVIAATRRARFAIQVVVLRGLDWSVPFLARGSRRALVSALPLTS